MNRAPNRTQHGFTLVEMVITIAIMGIMLGITAPAVSGYLRSSRLNGAANKLVADIHFARTLAREQRRTFQIRFASDRYSIVGVSTSNTVATRVLPPGVDCTPSDTATFYAWGLTDPVVVKMSNAHDSSMVRVSANGNVSSD